MQRNQVLAIVGQVKNSARSKVVDLQSVADRVIKVDACGRIQNDLHFVTERGTDVWGDAKTLQN